MSDIQKVKSILQDENLSCVLKCDSKIYKSTKSGIMPIMELILNNIDLKGFTVGDKIIGKAAALLFVYAGIKSAYAKVLSREAEKIFIQYKIEYIYDTITNSIINRNGDDVCPMEKVVAGISCPKEAFSALKYKLNL